MNRSTALRALAAGSLAANLPFRAFAAELQPLRIVSIPIDVGAEGWYGLRTGAFTRAGFDVTMEAIPNGAAIISAVVGGSADVGFSNVVSLAVAFKHGVPITLVAPAGEYSSKAPTSALMVAKDSPIRTARDCNGKTVAINGLKNITEYSTDAWLDKNGGDYKSVKYVEMQFPEMGPALAQGRVDVALLAEPALSRAKAVARVLADSYDAVAPEFVISAYFTTAAYARSHADAVKRFAGAMREIAAWADGHQRESGAILTEVAKLPPALVAGMTRSVYPERLTPSEIQPNIDVAVKYGGLVPFSASEMIWSGLS